MWAALALLLLATPAHAAVKVKGQATYKPYDKIVLVASEVTSDKAQFLWDVSGDAQVVEAGSTLYVWAAPGSYSVLLTAIDFDAKKVERARFSFSVEVPAPPTPPVPPLPPAPTDPLTQAFQVAYTADADADRAKSLAFLQAAYATMANAVPASATTNAAVAAWMKTVVEAPLPAGLAANQLKNLRTAIATELRTAWGANPAPLAADAAKAEIQKISAALQGVR